MYTTHILLVLGAATSVFAASPVVCPSAQYTQDPNPPSTRNCGGRGFLASPALAAPPTTGLTLDQCVAATKTAGSVSFGYSAGNQSCAMYTKRLIDMKYKSRTTDLGTQFYNSLCFKCAPVTCTPSNQAVTNGGFDDGEGGSATNWTIMGGQRAFFRDNYYVVGFPNPVIEQVLCVTPFAAYLFRAYMHGESNFDGQDVEYSARLDGQRFSIKDTGGGIFTGSAFATRASPTLQAAISVQTLGGVIDNVTFTLGG